MVLEAATGAGATVLVVLGVVVLVVVEVVEVVLLEAADVFDATPERPAVRLVRRGNYTIAVPVMEPHGKLIGPMFGGCFIHTCDSRFRKFVGHDYPVPLHDRWESPELNRMLSI